MTALRACGEQRARRIRQWLDTGQLRKDAARVVWYVGSYFEVEMSVFVLHVFARKLSGIGGVNAQRKAARRDV